MKRLSVLLACLVPPNALLNLNGCLDDWTWCEAPTGLETKELARCCEA